MINLMPPDLKTQIKYAKLNRVVLRYLRVTVVVAVVLAGIFVGALWYLQQQTTAVAADIASKQSEIKSKSSALLPKAKDASERLNAIKYVQDTQTKYSTLIADIVKVLPKDVDIDTIALTGDEKKSVNLTVIAKSYDQVLALRNSLVNSPRIEAADIVTIIKTSDTSWTAKLLFGFKPGQGK